MSVSSEVRRTLVKSPPELWAELSDPATLARHLGELGKIRITGTNPERLVDWEATSADGATLSGRVEIEPSGWGTRVTLSASRTIIEAPSEAEAQPETGTAPEPKVEPAPEPEAEVQPEPEIASGVNPAPRSEPAAAQASEPAPDAEAAAPTLPAEPSPGPEAVEATQPASTVAAELEPEPGSAPDPAPREGFFARLFRRRKRRPAPVSSTPVSSTPVSSAPVSSEPAAPEPEPITSEPEPETEAPEPELASEPASTPGPQPVVIVVEEVTAEELAAQTAPEREDQTSEPAAVSAVAGTPTPDIAAELAALEEQTTAVLTGVLDRLGAAHHRPFSRA